MGYGERVFGGKLYGYYAHTRTKREAKKMVKILQKQNFMKGYRIIPATYRKPSGQKVIRYQIYVR